MTTDIPTYIMITDKKKIHNPYFKGTVLQFSGTVDGFDFASQTLNYDRLVESLTPHGIFFTTIHYGKWKRQDGTNATSFIVTTNNAKVFWEKYDGNSSGAGQNKIIINGKKISTSSWVWLHNSVYDFATRAKLLNQ
jgi:hypothetical protein